MIALILNPLSVSTNYFSKSNFQAGRDQTCPSSSTVEVSCCGRWWRWTTGTLTGWRVMSNCGTKMRTIWTCLRGWITSRLWMTQVRELFNSPKKELILCGLRLGFNKLFYRCMNSIYCAVVSAENLLTRKSSRRLLRKWWKSSFPFLWRHCRQSTLAHIALWGVLFVSSDTCLVSSALLPCNSALSSILYFQRSSQKVAELSGERKAVVVAWMLNTDTGSWDPWN